MNESVGEERRKEPNGEEKRKAGKYVKPVQSHGAKRKQGNK